MRNCAAPRQARIATKQTAEAQSGFTRHAVSAFDTPGAAVADGGAMAAPRK
jgi:hypothetical protein